MIRSYVRIWTFPLFPLLFFLACFSRSPSSIAGVRFLERLEANNDDPFRVLLVLNTDRRVAGVGFPSSLPSASNTTPTIVHLSIRPYALPSDDPALSKKKRLSVAISRRLSSAGVTVGVGGGGRDVERDSEDEARRGGCCTGCTIC